MRPVERPLTVDEKKYIRPLNKKTELHRIKAKIATFEQKHRKTYRPFCMSCVLADIEMGKTMAIEEARRKGQAMSEDDAYRQAEVKELDKYISKDYFELLDKSEAIEHVLIGTTKVPQLIGYHYNYQCKKRGHGLSVFVPIAVEKERKEKDAASKSTGQSPSPQ